MRTAAAIYLVWAMILLGIGAKVYSNITDKKNPNSLQNRFNELEKVMNENP